MQNLIDVKDVGKITQMGIQYSSKYWVLLIEKPILSILVRNETFGASTGENLML